MNMQISSGLRQAAISAAVFCGMMTAVVSVDGRVRARMLDLLSGSGGTFTDRGGDVVDALMTAVRYQTIENAPLVVFAAVGAVLFVFMVRT